MKKIVVILTSIVVLFTTMAWAEDDKDRPACPQTLMNQNCMVCHIAPDFRLKEVATDAHLDYPLGFKFLDYPNAPKGYLTIGEIDPSLSSRMEKIIEYLKKYDVKTLTLDIQSPGGNIFDAWKVKGLLNEFQESGGIVETRLRGMALSAGFVLFCAGSIGHRYANPQAEMMIHEIGLFKGGLFYIEKVTPSSAEEEARILNHLQKTICDWLATRGKMTSKEIIEKVKQKEFWISGQEAHDTFGFVDHLVVGE